MNLRKSLLSLSALGILALVGVAIAQKPAAGEKPKQEPAEGGMEMPKPGPEHAALMKMVGTWDATVTMMGMDGKPEKSQATAVYKAVGDMWIVSDFSGTMMGGPFHGHGVDGYDIHKKKCVGTWIDSWSTSIMALEGTYDAATKTSTMIGESRDPSGKPVKHRMVTTMKDDDSMTFRMFMPGEDGKDVEGLTIEYKRRK